MAETEQSANVLARLAQHLGEISEMQRQLLARQKDIITKIERVQSEIASEEMRRPR